MSDDKEREAGNEPPAEQLPPYIIEGARSGRSRCKSCQRKINKGSLRIGMLIEGPFGPGYLWHHLKCAARRQLERVEEAYELEAWKEAKEVPKTVPPLYTLRELREQAEKQKAERKRLPFIENAPSGRSKCRHCGQLIAEGTPRVVLGRSVEFGRQVRTSPMNVHLECVGQALLAEDCATSPETFADDVRANSTGLEPEEIEAALDRTGVQ